MDGRRAPLSPNGPGTAAPQRVQAPQPPDLLSAPITSQRGMLAPALVAAKKMLRRLLGPIVLEPQARFNEAIAQTLAAQHEQLSGLAALAGHSRAGDTAVRFDYVAFEEQFRGSEPAIEARQFEYLDYFFERGEVLDIGCGRGEFLSLLREGGIPARGVDADEGMVAHCRELGLSVTCADAVTFLEAEPDGTFGGVFLSQVVEHLSTDELVTLMDAVGRKTAPGAVLIVETINPESMPVLMRWFWLDPTHVRLLHPETMQFFIRQAGFEVKTVQFRRPVPEGNKLPRLELSGVPADELAAFNESIDTVNGRLFGGLDYFVVGVAAR